MASDRKAELRHLPRIDEILGAPALRDLVLAGRGRVAFHARAVVEQLRRRLLENDPGISATDLALEAVVRATRHRVAAVGEPLPRVLNATGVVLHSGLGRAPLPEAAVAAMQRAGGYALLEVDRDEGERLARDTRIGELLVALTGAEAAFVVNNNAAATLLILNALAAGHEVVCSRGELVEIGGSYRIPDVMEASGCRLVAVGTTNKTHLADYERAITPATAALLVVHTSNYRIVGFTSAPALDEVAILAKRRGLPLVHDLGSGSLLGPEELGFGDEPPVRASLAAGADVVCMSGDKLLGGPQAGIILGRRDLIATMRRNPLARALRIDKSTAAALEATLQLFLDPETLDATHPVIGMLRRTPAELEPRATALATRIVDRSGGRARTQLCPLASETGSGALPTVQIPSVGVLVSADGLRPAALARALRHATPAVFTRIVDDRVALDLRTLLPGEELEAADTVADTVLRMTTKT